MGSFCISAASGCPICLWGANLICSAILFSSSLTFPMHSPRSTLRISFLSLAISPRQGGWKTRACPEYPDGITASGPKGKAAWCSVQRTRFGLFQFSKRPIGAFERKHLFQWGKNDSVQRTHTIEYDNTSINIYIFVLEGSFSGMLRWSIPLKTKGILEPSPIWVLKRKGISRRDNPHCSQQFIFSLWNNPSFFHPLIYSVFLTQNNRTWYHSFFSKIGSTQHKIRGLIELIIRKPLWEKYF